ncbi:MAG: ATP-dependent helicase [Candidatus Paceibacterota bacterium]|jgi:DNA helicase-2/ATP-dependent DNA helicase PcrA
MDNSEKYKSILESSAKKVSVIAGPGSGKTKNVLIPMAQNLIKKGVDEKEILILSFSRLSAIDLKNRVEGIGSEIRASTVHSFCLSFLLSEDGHDIRSRIDSFLLDFEKKFLFHDLKIIFPTTDIRKMEKTFNEFSAGWAIKPHDEVFEKNEDQRKFKRAVIYWLEEHKACMLDEIIYFGLDLARKNPSSPHIDNVKYILIDEYQDLNQLEQEFISILADNFELLLVVGDPDQSIYSFKFAYPSGIVDFSNQEDVEDYFLDYCGRCAKKILGVANQLLLQNDPARKQLPLSLPGKEDGEFTLKSFNDQEEEFAYIYQSILTLLEKGIQPKEIMVLFPRKNLGSEFYNFTEKNNRLLKEVNEDAEFLFSSNIKFNNKEQEQILLLSLLINKDSVLHIRAYLGLNDDKTYANEIKEVKDKYGNLNDFINNVNLDDFPRSKRRVRELCNRAIHLKEILDSLDKSLPIGDIIDNLFPSGDVDLVNLNLMMKSLVEPGDDIDNLYRKFIDQIKTVPIKDDAIRIMSIMGSKGLDSDHVFILGCNAGNIPGENRSDYLSDQEYKKEQRRLLYVGFTRARKSLTVTWTKYIPYAQALRQHTAIAGTVTRGGEKYCCVAMSEFLQDLNC